MTVEEVYRARCAAFAHERDHLTRRWNRLANLRLLAFLIAALCLVLGWWRRAPVLAIVGLASLVCFVVLVRRHRRLGRARQRAELLWQINDEAGKRLARAWSELPLRHAYRSEPGHPYAADLDLFGRASLFHLIQPGGTSMGERTLARWLLGPAGAETVRDRQAAVAELAPLLDLRDELVLRGRLLGEAKPDPEPFLAWAEGGQILARRRGLLWCARISPALLWVTWLAQAVGVLPFPLWILFLIANGALSWRLGRTVHDTLARVESQEGAFRHYAESLALLATPSFAAPALARLQSELTVDGLAAHEHLRRLHRLTTLVIPRSSLVYGLVQILTLWDVHLLAALERWQATVGARARGWLAALGEAETLAALAGLAHDNPDWAFPVLDREARSLEAEDLGHPLLSRNVRVTNGVEVGPHSTFLLVTGSNMSGKSTLLRALGVNIVLAGAGGPVCARSLRMPPVALWTSMRVQDSLAEGVSYFMAELQRLKGVVDAARSTGAGDERRLFYLLDEILQGTNTVERQIAARRIIGYLVARGALGAVSTHDLTLADGEEIAAAARPIHFTETITTAVSGDAARPAMSFDYQIRPGLATSTNALRLMEIVGLELGEAEGKVRGS